MKRFFALSFAAIALLFACGPEENNPASTDEPGGKDNTVHVTGISLDRNSVTIKEGETITLVATVTPSNADNKSVSWSSSSDAVATVDASGKVTGVKAGSATITATAEDGGMKATCALSVEPYIAPVVTGEADHISAISVVLHGKANLGTTVASDLKIGFQYSKSAGIMPSNSTTVEGEDADANYNYTTAITGLDPETKYYFRSFVRQNGQDTYGETKEFSTRDVASILETKEATHISAVSASMNAKLDLTDVKYTSKSYGFYSGTSEISQNTKFNGGEIKDNAYSTSRTGLSHKTQYWYKAFVTLDTQTFYGEVKTFTTDVVPVESVSLDKTEYTFNTIGNALTLKATVLPADATDKSVTWASDNEAVAIVSSSGTVKAIGNGTAIITVTTTDQEKTAACTVTVAQRVTGITLDKTLIILNEGQEQTLIPTVNPSNAADKSLTWASSNTSVATVDVEGKVRAVSKGDATITATANDGSGKYASCSVTVRRLVTTIELNKTSLILYRGTSNVTKTLTATVAPSDASNTAVTWTSSNTSVAMVSSSGVITGKAKGTATITVTAKDGNGARATCKVEVRQFVTSITLDKTSLSLEIGDEASITVSSILPDNANDKSVTWSSSDNTIASVDNSGKVTAKAKGGNATIKATANDGSGVCASCAVVVKNPCPVGAVDLGLSVYWATSNIGAEKPEEYGDYYAWGETEAKSNYSWLTYKWGTNSTTSSTTLTKYNTNSSYGTVDKKEYLDPEDDVAHVKLGGKWRMPTLAEWDELCEKCTWIWTSNYNGTGVKGRIVTSTNGNSIFLPAAGIRSGSSLSNAGSYGIYWSSDLDTFDPDEAWHVCFDSEGIVRTNHDRRFFGRSVRPVTE